MSTSNGRGLLYGQHIKLKMTCWNVNTTKFEESYSQSRYGGQYLSPNGFYQQFDAPGYFGSDAYFGFQSRVFGNSSLSYSASPPPSYPRGVSPFTPGENGTYSARSSPTSHASFHSEKSSSSRGSKSVCRLCFQNEGPRSFFYFSHQLKDEHGNVVCPVLQKHVCEYCGATGAQAHTISYCPILKEKGAKKRSAISLKNTHHNSCGRIRHFK